MPTRTTNVVDLIPQKTLDEMEFYINTLVSLFPEENVTETVSEWAERKRTISRGLTSAPGKYDFNVTPYIREIVDCLSVLSPVRETYYQKGTQVGGTVGIIENYIGYCIEYGIGPLLYISGDQTMAEEQMEKRVDQMIESAGLQGKIKPAVTKAKGKATGDRSDSKSYGGTFIRAVGPHSESKLRSFPIRGLLMDEMDVYPLTLVKGGVKHGSSTEKAERRTDGYEESGKIFGISTPKDKATSQIEPKFNEGDKRYYMFRCPACNHQQPLEWKNFKWEKNAEGKINILYTTINGVEIPANDPTYYECSNPECKRHIKEHEKYELLLEVGRGGTSEWVPTKKPDRPFVRSYHTNALYGRRRWMNIALQWERVCHDPLLRNDFINDVLGETTTTTVDQPSEHELMQRAEPWDAGTISKDIIFLTIAADVQGDRIEAMLTGWGRDRQAYAVDYWRFPLDGSKGNPTNAEDVSWSELDAKICNIYQREDGVQMLVQATFIDSQYFKDAVYKFCEGFAYYPDSIGGVYPVIARQTISGERTCKLMKSDIGTPVVGLHDQKLKRGLYIMLQKRPYRDGFPNSYIHFPRTFGLTFYEQLTAEEVFSKTMSNGTVVITVENRKQRRNEALDCMKYNIALYQFLYDRYFEIENEKLKKQLKKQDIQPSDEDFMNAMEAALLGISESPDAGKPLPLGDAAPVEAPAPSSE